MGFEVRRVKGGSYEIVGLEAFIEERIAALLERPGRPGKGRKRSKGGRGAASAGPGPEAIVQELEAVRSNHPHGKVLAEIGTERDQLLRSLVPLYLARGTPLAVSSGAISRYWALHGVSFAAPNAAKALRQYRGYAKRTARGVSITPKGVQYVEGLLRAAR